MPKTDAERQQAWRDRRARLIATLKQENARLRTPWPKPNACPPTSASTPPPQSTAAPATPAAPTSGDPARDTRLACPIDPLSGFTDSIRG